MKQGNQTAIRLDFVNSVTANQQAIKCEDPNRLAREQDLIDWAKRQMREKNFHLFTEDPQLK